MNADRNAGPADARMLDWTLLALLIALGGSSFAFIRVALETVPPVVVTVGRLWIAAAILYAVMRATGRNFPPLLIPTDKGLRPHALWAWMMSVGFVGYTVPFFIFPWAQQYVESGLAGVYMAFMPLWTLGLAYLFAGESLTPQRIAGFLLGFAGVLILLGPEAIAGAAGSSVAAQAGLLVATLLYAASAVMSRRAPPVRASVFSAGLVLAGAVFATPALMFAEIDPASWSARSLTSVIILGLGPTALAGLIIIRIIQRVGASFMALANYVTPVWAVVAGAVVFGERLEATAFLALGVILAGVAVSQRKSRVVVSAGDAAPADLGALMMRKASKNAKTRVR